MKAIQYVVYCSILMLSLPAVSFSENAAPFPKKTILADTMPACKMHNCQHENHTNCQCNHPTCAKQDDCMKHLSKKENMKMEVMNGAQCSSCVACKNMSSDRKNSGKGSKCCSPAKKE